MAILSDDEVKLRLAFEADGTTQVEKLAREIEGLAADAGLAAPSFSQLASEIREIGQQKVRVDGLQLAIDGAKSARAAFVDARHEVQVLDKALADAKGAGANKQAVEVLEAALRSANTELRNTERAWTRQKDTLSQARAEAAAVGIDTRNLASEQTRLKTALESATKAASDQQKALSDQRGAAEEEIRLASIVEASKKRQQAAAQELLVAEKRAYAEIEAARRAAAQAAAQVQAEAEARRKKEAADIEAYSARTRNALSDAFSGAGVRSSATIQAEIFKIQQSLQKLGQDAKVSGADFDRAMAQAQQRISALQAEMRGGVDPFTDSLSRSNSELSGFASRLTPIAGAIAAAFGATEVARMAADFDSLNRAMAAIQGAGARAAAEVGYITDASNRLGIELQSVSKTYISWLAAIKGTALEGERGRAVFEAVAGAMAKLGKSAADTEGAMLALGQMVSKGKVSMEELRGQLGESLPGALQAAARGAGLTVEQLTKMVESGQVLAEDLLPGLAAELNKLYGNTQADGMVNQWNRLKNAVFETAGQITQTEAVMRSFGMITGVLKETVLVLGTGVITVSEGIGLLGKTIGATAAAIQSGNWSGLREEITKMAGESADRIAALAGQTKIAAGVQMALGSAVADAGNQAAGTANQYLAITAAYTEVNAAVTKQVELSQAALAARKAEASAAMEYVQLFGTEAEKRAEAADQSKIEAEALQRVAEAKQMQASISTALLAALQAEVEAMDNVSPARKKEIEDLQTSTKLKAEEAVAATSAAQASQIRAAGLQTESEAYADNSKRVTALREAWAAASAEAESLSAAVKAGVATKDEAAAASIRAGQAEKLYRDALADSITALQAKAAVTRSQIDLESKGRSLQLEQIQTQIEVARARGRDNEVARLQIDYARVQMEMANLKAKALRAEAEAQMALIAAKRAELEASGQLTEVKRLELDAQQKAAEAKIVDARIAEELASRTRQLKDVVRGTASEMDSAAASAEKLGDSWDGAANSADRYASSARAAAKASADGTETRGFRQGSVDTYAIAAENGLNDAEAKRFAEVYQEFLAKANAEVRSRAAGTQGLGFGPKEYADIISYYTQRALEQAKMDVNTPSPSASSSAGAEKAPAIGMGQIVKTVYQVDLRTNSGTQTVSVSDQPSVDALLKTLQEYKSRS